MYKFVNNIYSSAKQASTDLFITSIGYEERSFLQFDNIQDKVDKDNFLIFLIDDYDSFDDVILSRINEIREKFNVKVVSYSDDILVRNTIIETIQEKCAIIKDRMPQVDIDYTSMPRGWYCTLPEELFKTEFNVDINYWYSEGKYIDRPPFESTAGISAYRLTSGRPSFRTNRSRTHFIGLGYDAIRTQGIISILDPENCVFIDAYNPEFMEVHNNVKDLNKSILEQCQRALSFDITDIEYMASKIKGVINEYSYVGDNEVILVPDGPKPLIFVMALMPLVINREGISCLHVVRNNSERKKLNVAPTKKVIGFSLIKENDIEEM